jgi:hypothetical protein
VKALPEVWSLLAFVHRQKPVATIFRGLSSLGRFFLDFPADLFANTLGFQVGIVRQLAHLFLNLAPFTS